MDSSSTSSPSPAVDATKRRAPRACRKCRRSRSKCVYEKGNRACEACLESGETCEFTERGDPENDRQYRHPRTRADKKPKREVNRVKSESSFTPVLHNVPINTKLCKWEDYDDRHLLPCLELVRDGVIAFTLHFFQLSFIQKERFLLQLDRDPQSVSPFLLLSILSIAARFSNKLQKQFGPRQTAVNIFAQRAEQVASKGFSQQPTLERCQAFFLLGLAQQDQGMTNKSYINMGVAMRMAALMHLHREETYERITPQSTQEEIIRAESARRTLWMIYLQDNLDSGPYKPVSFALDDITALLPCDEKDFRNIKIPQSRAGLAGTPPATKNPQLTTLSDRSLFATLIQTHHLWGIVARRAVANEKSSSPGDADSEYARIAARLTVFEQNLPSLQKFDETLLKGHRSNSLDLAYLGCTMVIRLCNIVLRKVYLSSMIRLVRDNPLNPLVQTFKKMADELFENVKQLYDQVDVHFSDERPPEERVGTRINAFCVYSCGLMAAYMCKYPQLVPNKAPCIVQNEGKVMYERTIAILEEITTMWPIAKDWLNGLRKWNDDTGTRRGSLFEGASMTDGQDPQPYALLHPPTTDSCFHGNVYSLYQPPGRSTPPYADDRRQKMATEPTHLPPLQQLSSASYSDPLSLPPIASYFHHHQQQQQQQQQHQSQHSSSHAQQIYPQSEGFNTLYHSGGPHHHHGQQQSYMTESVHIDDDGYNFSLGQIVGAKTPPAAL